jgi:hypothetical protein
VKGSLRSDDRVLLLGIPSHRELASIARVLIRGALVALGTREEVDQARAEMAKVLVAQHLAPLLAPFADELQRILAPGGEIVRLTEHV